MVCSSQAISRTKKNFRFRFRFRLRVGIWTGYEEYHVYLMQQLRRFKKSPYNMHNWGRNKPPGMVSAKYFFSVSISINVPFGVDVKINYSSLVKDSIHARNQILWGHVGAKPLCIHTWTQLLMRKCVNWRKNSTNLHHKSIQFSDIQLLLTFWESA